MLNAQPSGSWKFDSGVVSVFDDMVSRSVPLYKETIELARKFYEYHPGKVADLGCATGAVANAIGGPVVCVDSSFEMLEKCKEKNPEAECVQSDLGLGIPSECEGATYFTCLWTAQFVPIEKRQRLFAEVFKQCKMRNGGFFIAEKIRGQDSVFQSRLVEQYHDWKRESAGYTVEQIAMKSRSLENSLVSFDAPSMKQCLTAEGFKVEEVIRYLSFAAWYCHV